MNTTPDTIAIQVKNLTKYFNDLKAVDGLSLGVWAFSRRHMKIA